MNYQNYVQGYLSGHKDTEKDILWEIIANFGN